MLEERPITDWLPLTKKEMEKRGWDELDIILVSGDAYVDHPSFGTAVIGRIMEDEGFKVGENRFRSHKFGRYERRPPSGFK